MRASSTLVLIASLAGLTACRDDSRDPFNASAAIGFEPDCQVGCLETDPFPDSGGVFLGSGVTPTVCVGGEYTDADQDGLGDFCEKQLSSAFSPELYHWGFDNVGREPYWVARPLEGGEGVRIAYLLSYYRDEGSASYLCGLPPPLYHWSCDGHNGDSEIIYVDAYYAWTTQHWALETAGYSQHGDLVTYGPTDLYFPAHEGSYPRAYVAEGKHASYSTIAECNGGGAFGTDTCEHVNTATRLEWSAFWNLGSRAHHTSGQDCLESRNTSYQYYGSGRAECYWTSRRFRGWIPTSVGGADADPYSDILGAVGF